MSNGTFLYPNVTSIPSQTGATSTDQKSKKPDGVTSEFDHVFDQTVAGLDKQPDLSQVKAPLKFSAHASQRLRERKIAIDPATMQKINDAVDKAESKGVEDTLILTPDTALIVNVSNRTVVTALDRKSASGNVFTNIDGAVVI
jgi:flagellar operon protein